MEISKIVSHQVNFKSQDQTQKSPIDAFKNKVENMDDKEKIVAGLSALSVMALAGIAIAKAPHKAKQVAGELSDQKTVQQAADVVDGVVESAKTKIKPKTDSLHLSKDKKVDKSIQQGVERAVDAAKEYVQGGNYGEIKEKATKNLTHEGKKVVKKTLEKVHSDKVAQDITTQHNLSNITAQISKNAAQEKNIRQGVKNFVDNERFFDSRRIDSDLDIDVKEKLIEAKELAEKLGTRKAKKALYRAQKAAEKAENEHMKTVIQTIERSSEIVNEKNRKEANTLIQMTSPNYLNGLIKQSINANKQAKTRLKTLIARKTQHGKMTEKQAFEMIAGNLKETAQTRKLALDRLKNL